MSEQVPSKDLLRAALAEWDQWRPNGPGVNDRSVTFAHVLTMRGKAVEQLIEAARAAVRAADEPPAAPYRVEPTRCNCHPETCCCPDYTIWKRDIPIARGSDERLLREFVLTENARASQPPSVNHDESVLMLQDAEDAKRYRWIRDNQTDAVLLIVDWDLDGADGDELDTAIDSRLGITKGVTPKCASCDGEDEVAVRPVCSKSPICKHCFAIWYDGCNDAEQIRRESLKAQGRATAGERGE